ncbi:fimbrial protein [Serratia fonticola]|uniref:Fimbrial protein n=1 Tax=Serratia fonticola TaxID=47917 RepID=A0AAW3WP83_SERFO|nr:fimbrial protein [Serratia fonticola]MBC3212474.1 fimbrial protein [Serratia fonticola]NYA13012.1 fimbrial protein [Serratia fonticola]NYA32590.1 fimbrial protein [Serratia fonticola]
MNRFINRPKGRSAFQSLWRTAIGTVGGLALCLSVAQASNQLALTIKGIVMTGPACIVNGNTAIDVNFGSALQTTSIDGNNYATPVPFSLSCTGSASSLRLRFQGSVSGFDPGVLATNFPDLGIKLLKPDSSALALGEWFTFGYSATPPAISAVPVKRPGAILPGGVFNSTATLLVEVL